MKKIIGIIGLGYVGLPLLVALSKKFETIGYDQNKKRIEELKKKKDITLQFKPKNLQNLNLVSDHNKINKCNIYILTVPTPITKNKKPDLKHIISATKLLAKKIKKKDIIIYESTVFPGCTEQVCGKIIEKKTNLILNKDFFLGYSPERISPGETTKNIRNIVKIVAGSNKKTTNTINLIYKKIIKKTYITKNIKVAEAAKVIENTQRDLNIAFVNELSKIFNKINIETKDVLDAASTKWNFVKYFPGIVGGHCIGVDPYYLTYISKLHGYKPQVILSGREINDGMGNYIAKRFVNMMKVKKINLKKSKVLILGLTFKENCPDIRNSKVFDIINSLIKKNIKVEAYDPWIQNLKEIKNKNFALVSKFRRNKYDGVLIAVKHKIFLKLTTKKIRSFCKKKHLLFDIKNLFPKSEVDGSL